jgi:hypothetical protein
MKNHVFLLLWLTSCSNKELAIPTPQMVDTTIRTICLANTGEVSISDDECFFLIIYNDMSNYKSVAYDSVNDVLVAVGDGGLIKTSTNKGRTWKTQLSGTTENFVSVHANSKFMVAVTNYHEGSYDMAATNGHMFFSNDKGNSWRNIKEAKTDASVASAYWGCWNKLPKNMYDDNRIMVTRTLFSRTAYTSSWDMYLCFANYLVDNNGSVRKINEYETERTIGGSGDGFHFSCPAACHSYVRQNDVWLVGEGSVDGNTSHGDLYRSEYKFGLWTAPTWNNGNYSRLSTCATGRREFTTKKVRSIASDGGNKFMIVCYGNEEGKPNSANIAYSSDKGDYFTDVFEDTALVLNEVIYKDGMWVVVGNGGVVLVSKDDGATWKNINIGTSSNLRTVFAF